MKNRKFVRKVVYSLAQCSAECISNIAHWLLIKKYNITVLKLLKI